MNKLQHGMNCDALAHPIDGDCTCGLAYRERIAQLETELMKLKDSAAPVELRRMRSKFAHNTSKEVVQ